jgi:hypothetical protein
MTDEEALRPATADEVENALAFALRFSGRKRTQQGSELVAQIAAERLVEHLERSGFVIMKKPPLGSHGEPPRAMSPADAVDADPL